uniref:ZP domain-containing protein n=1 Tax=Globodera pallida TaxID=36090 RepID=A0A183CIY7_GLOPA
MNNVLICFILIIIYGNFDGVFAVSKSLLTDRTNGLHVFNTLHLHCAEGDQNSSEAEPKGHQLHFRIDEGFCGGAQEFGNH